MTCDRRFRFGAQLSFAGTREEWVAKARRVEELGYSTLCVPDHFDDQLAPMPALTAAAAATTNLRVGTLVLDNDYRHPILTAKEAATVDLLSGGRLELGLGAGWLRSDYEQSGIALDPPSVRIDRLEEALAVVKGLLAGGKFSFCGRHYTVTNHPGTPLSVQRPRPPILVGGGGRRILALAGREADIVSVNFDLSSGAIGTHLGATATAGATAEKVRLGPGGGRRPVRRHRAVAHRLPDHGHRRPGRGCRRPRLRASASTATRSWPCPTSSSAP